APHCEDVHALASGKVAVLLTHLGPGLTNAATGVANAALDSIPMVVIAGDIPSHYYGKHRHQEENLSAAAPDSPPMGVIARATPSHYYGKHPHQEVNLHADASQYEIYRPFVKRAWRV